MEQAPPVFEIVETLFAIRKKNIAIVHIRCLRTGHHQPFILRYPTSTRRGNKEMIGLLGFIGIGFLALGLILALLMLFAIVVLIIPLLILVAILLVIGGLLLFWL
jgi:hypothetical protein